MLEVLANLPENIFFNLGIILIVAAFIAYLAKLFRQPLIPAYIIAGLVLGPIGFGIIKDVEMINSISEVGIMFLLFIVGLELDLNKLKSVGWVTVITGTLQVLLTFAATYFIALALGLDSLNAVYAGLVVAFSSTMIVIKLLSDAGDLNTLHGRIILGVLFMQDVLVILALMILTSASTFSAAAILPIVWKFLLLGIGAYLLSKYIAYPIFRFAAASGELLFLLAVAVCFLFAFAAYLLGFSIAIGAFLGGITLGTLPYNVNIVARISSLKDFFATIFFVALGLQLVLPDFGTILTPFFVFLALILLLKPLIVMIILSVMGFDKRSSFVSSIALAQISEFGLILALTVDNMSQELFTITILLGIITIALTSYILKFELHVYNALIPVLKLFEKLSKRHRELGMEYSDHKKIILFGANRTGEMFLRKMAKVQKTLLVVDSDPEVIEKLKRRKISCMYGDMANPELLKKIRFHYARVAISTAPNAHDNLVLLKYLRSINSKALTFVTASTIPEALNLYDAGADYVIIPQITSGERLAHLLERHMYDKKTLKRIKSDHLKHLLNIHAQKYSS